MFDWRKKPFIYEINTAVWLSELSRLYQTPVSLYDVPDEILDEFVDLRFDAIWLMGVWYRSEGARKSALRYKHEYQHALPNLEDEDVIGSAYSIGAYEVDERLGGREGLAQLRERLRQRSIKLILDYVPNHVSIDHPWITHNTHFLIQGTPQLLKQEPELFFAVKNGASSDLIIAHGRDPHFPGWIDTAQVNAFNPDYREQVRQTLLDLAGQCDGVRCDMAMLVTNDIFARTWGGYLTESHTPDRILAGHHPDDQGTLSGFRLYRRGLLGSGTFYAGTGL
jgi:glycosidase